MMALYFLLGLSALCYFSACAVNIFRRKKNIETHRLFYPFSILGFVLQTVALIYLAYTSGRLPISNSYEMMESVAWAIVLIDFLTAVVLGARIIGSMSMIVAALLTLAPLFCPVFSKCVFEAHVASKPDLAAFHGVLAILSYAFLCLSAMFSGAYILQLRALKKRTAEALASNFLPLPRVLRFARRALGIACFAMALSLLIGILAAFDINLTLFMKVKFASASVLFAAMLGLLWLSFKKELVGKSFARLCIILFILSILILIPIELRNI